MWPSAQWVNFTLNADWAQRASAQFEIWNGPQAMFACMNTPYSHSAFGKRMGNGIETLVSVLQTCS